MRKMLSPTVIVKIYTLSQIEAKITELQTAYSNAVENQSYSFDDVQAKQSVRTQPLDILADQLNIWLKAKSLLSGESQVDFYAGNFTGTHD